MEHEDFDDIEKEFKTLYDYTQNGKCIQCGSCCSNLLPMTDTEIKNIHKHIKKYRIKEQKRVLPTANPTMDMTCPFLNLNKSKEKCVIYSVRPKICRAFICSPSGRKPLDRKYAENAKIIDVRQEFFG